MKKEYNKYKSKYLNMYMDSEDILLVKQNIQYLTHYTDILNCESIFRDNILKHGSNPHIKVLNMSVFPAGEYRLGELPLSGKKLLDIMGENFNISMCGDDSIVLLFDPKILWKTLYYYFSYYDEYGMSGADMYISKGIINKIITSTTPKKVIKEMKKYDNVKTEKLKDMISKLSGWPEIGFYTNIDVKKYLKGIVVPKIHCKKIKGTLKKYGYNNIEIFICDDYIIKKL